MPAPARTARPRLIAKSSPAMCVRARSASSPRRRVAISSTGGEAGTGVAGTYGAYRATDLDLAALARLSTDAGDGKGPVLRIYSALQLSDVAVADERGVTVKIARLAGGTSAHGNCRMVGTAPSNPHRRVRRPRDPTIRNDGRGQRARRSVGRQPGDDGLSVSDSTQPAPVLAELERLSYAASGADAGVTIEGLTFAAGAGRSRLGKLTLTEPPSRRSSRNCGAAPNGRTRPPVWPRPAALRRPPAP